jgi:dimethylhistidine N-methyltransferase
VNQAFHDDMIAALSRPVKSISPKWFYDEAGSDLFEQITTLEEYYPTRTEAALLANIAPELSSAIPDGAVMVEFGSGASAKTRILLDAAPQLSAYVPMDISVEALDAAARNINADYPALEVWPVAGDFTHPIALPAQVAGRVRVGFFPGSTIGNFGPVGAADFLTAVRGLLGKGASLIIGADLVKDAATLVTAYDDRRGVTAAFNLNLLARANREIGADFDLRAFDHRAVWNADESRMEMHLVSRSAQTVHIDGRPFAFSAGESLHTENSYKFTRAGFEALANSAGWRLERSWVSPAPEFAVFVLN